MTRRPPCTPLFPYTTLFRSRVLAQRRAHPLVAGGRRVALVEDEIDDLEHRREARSELGPARDFERDARLAQGPLGPDDRSEEHTSELQSLRHLVCRLLLEKK